MNIDYDKLSNIPFIARFDKTSFSNQVNRYYDEWTQFKPYYDQIALIRAIECTNGCVQYALRDQESYALSIEQSRECMQLSMKFIISKELTFPNGEHIAINLDLAPQLDKVRQLYIDGFKKHKKLELQKFYAHSVAMFNAIGQDHIDDAIAKVYQHYEYPFTSFFICYGHNYMNQFLEVCPNEENNLIPSLAPQLNPTLDIATNSIPPAEVTIL